MIKLREAMKTKYIIDSLSGELLNILDNAASSKTTVDLDQCKFGVITGGLLSKYYGKVIFCNTSNEYLDKILKHNMNAVLDKLPLTAQPLEIDNIQREEDIISYIDEIDTTIIYSLENCKKNKLKCLSLAILLTIEEPDIVFDLREYASDLFRYVRVDWLEDRKSHDKYNEVVGEALVTREVVDGKVYRPGDGWLNEDDFVSNYNVLPFEFGTEYLGETEEFSKVMDTAINNILYQLGKTSKMKDYIVTLE